MQITLFSASIIDIVTNYNIPRLGSEFFSTSGSDCYSNQMIFIIETYHCYSKYLKI